MRIAFLLLIAIASLSCGCSAFVASCGKDLTALETKEEVHGALGKPERIGVEKGASFEEYFSRRKFAIEPLGDKVGSGMMCGLTFGASELVVFPIELYLEGKRTLLGQTIRVTYDAKGQVIERYLDGKRGVFQESLWSHLASLPGWYQDEFWPCLAELWRRDDLAPTAQTASATESATPANPGR